MREAMRDAPSVDPFDIRPFLAARRHIYALMEKDSFTRFRKTKQFAFVNVQSRQIVRENVQFVIFISAHLHALFVQRVVGDSGQRREQCVMYLPD